jgi:hypothetical protein
MIKGYRNTAGINSKNLFKKRAFQPAFHLSYFFARPSTIAAWMFCGVSE